jgi:chaperone modulatory protein CbpM
MKIEVTEVHWMDPHAPCSLRDLAEASRLTEAELRELVELGVLRPLSGFAGPTGSEMHFAVDCLSTARSARRLREDFDLDAQGLSVALALIERIDDLERQLRALRARLPTTRTDIP